MMMPLLMIDDPNIVVDDLGMPLLL